jgi:hypothetical protein
MKYIKKFEAFTFKTEKPKGRYSWVHDDLHEIKLKGKKIGEIDPKKPYKIKLMVFKSDEDKAKPNDNKNCAWKWITLKKESDNLAEAKEFLNKNFDAIITQFNIRSNP